MRKVLHWHLRIVMLAWLLVAIVPASSARSLSREKADKYALQLAEEWRNALRQQTEDAWLRKVVKADTLTMPIWTAVYGDMPVDGRSLWISLHGGGNAPAAVNDQQWENQKHLYRPAEGVYVAPRAPYNDWDMWFKPLLDGLYERLIQMCVAHLGVNPNKVYLLGYSAGGDGLWRMGPRMADHWAAASMMAGHPGDVSLLNLRNTPFMVWCGAEDYAYDRNRLDAERGLELDSLHRADPDGYLHETHIMQGMGHWMQRADTLALPWMAQYVRNPYPRTIVWQQEEVLRPHFYWLTAPTDELRRGQRVRLVCRDNIIEISECTYSTLTFWLTDEIVNLDQPVEVRFEGRRLFRGKIARSQKTMRESLAVHADPSYICPALLTVHL
ncbi:MAG: alpha/beta hydrolase [Bacteroidales bacterium]|nr:alpha/beta hydrolase [Bacteroidales bacterium]